MPEAVASERSQSGPRLKSPQRSTIGPLSEGLPTSSAAWNSSHLDPYQAFPNAAAR
jgi:hypothetical protein